MSYLNTHDRTVAPTNNDLFQPTGRATVLFGVYMGFVKGTRDVQKNGRIQVWIPELGSAPDNPDGWIIANYCSPFAGATNVETISTTNVQSFEGTQTSYGMWMVPPDINNQVLIMFINGDPSRAIWIGCLFNQYINNGTPGAASSDNNYQYNSKNIPVAEYNKWDQKVTSPDTATKPYDATKFKGIGNQGLINDTVRGVTDASARRESPSTVFGIKTPGPVIDSTATPSNIRRKGGSSFVMDDGIGTECVQLTTKSGAQIKIDETNGFVYLINRDGTAWVQMDQYGNIDIFGAKDISMRAQRDLNIRADRNVNIEAGQNIFMKAAKDTTQETTTFTYDVNNIPQPKSISVWKYKGEGKGQGGNIVMQALNNWQSTTQKGAFLTVIENNMNVNIGNSLNITTQNGGQNFNSKQGIKMTTDAAFDLAATGNIRAGSKGTISVVGINDIIFCTNASLNLKAISDIQIAAAGDTLLSTTNFGVTAQTLFSDTVGIVGATSIAGGLFAAGPVQLGGSVPVTPPTDANPASAEGAMSASAARPAEVKPLNDKINILATWASTVTYRNWQPNKTYSSSDIIINNNIIYIARKDVPALSIFDITYWTIYTPEDKFKRKSESLQTTVSRFPTYEPCPEHETFKSTAISGYTPVITENDKTYEGSSGAGNGASAPPAASVDPGSNNTSVTGDPPADTSVSKDVNINALRNQLKVHEGIVNKSYTDSVGLLTAGIGHLLRTNEIPQYPLGSPISDEQIETWFTQDSSSAIKISQELLGDTWGELTDVRKRAIIDLAYNMGKSRLSKFNAFLNAIKLSQYDRAGQELRNSKWFTQVGRRGPNIQTMIVQNVDPTQSDRKFPG